MVGESGERLRFTTSRDRCEARSCLLRIQVKVKLSRRQDLPDVTLLTWRLRIPAWTSNGCFVLGQLSGWSITVRVLVAHWVGLRKWLLTKSQSRVYEGSHGNVLFPSM